MASLGGDRAAIVGHRDHVSPEVLRLVIAEGNVPEVVRIEEALHVVQNEAPERVNAELLRWLGPA